jgi:hypothetical protein
VAKQLASAALERARRLGDDQTDASEPVGIALVAALPTTPRRRGRDRIHVALQTHQGGLLWSLQLTKDAHTREQAESIADEMIGCAIAALLGSEPDDSFFRDAGLNLESERFDT